MRYFVVFRIQYYFSPRVLRKILRGNYRGGKHPTVKIMSGDARSLDLWCVGHAVEIENSPMPVFLFGVDLSTVKTAVKC